MHDFQRDLMFLLHDVARLLRVDADKRARAHGMTRAQWGILIWLERQPGLSQKELAEFLEVEPITVARLIDRLEARGMVERRPDPKDRRIWRLHLCPPAHGVLREIDCQRAQMRALVTSGLDDATIDTMTEALIAMKLTLIHEAHLPRRLPAGRSRSAGGRLMSQAATAGAAPRVAEAPVRSRRRMSRALLRPILMLGGILVVAVASGAYWLTGGRYVSIDDAYVRAAKETLSTDVSGIVAAVPVHEGQRVKKGDVLLRLDPQQFQIMLDAAKANLSGIVLSVNAMKLDYQRMLRDVDVKQAQVQSDQANFERYANLVKVGRRHPRRLRQHALPACRQPAGGDRAEDDGRGAARQAAGQSGRRCAHHARIPAGQGAGGRGAAPARPRGDLCAVRRHRDAGRYRAARHVPRRLHRGVRHRLHRATSGSRPIRRRPSSPG